MLSIDEGHDLRPAQMLEVHLHRLRPLGYRHQVVELLAGLVQPLLIVDVLRDLREPVRNVGSAFRQPEQ